MIFMPSIPRHSLLFALTLSLLSVAPALAQDPRAQVLKPPKGTSVALMVFEDLQCPQCRRVAPILEQASKTYKIPVVRHDFPLPIHNWSYNAAVMARYFDTHSKELGNEYRDYIFSNQLEINPQNLQGFSERFATSHKIQLPFVIDPDGKLAGQVNTDRDLGKSISLEHTPTIFIVSTRKAGRPYVEVTDIGQLYQMIDAVMNE